MKKILTALLTFSVLLTLSLTVYAHDVPQERDDCTIEIIVRYDGKNVDGGTVTAIKIGYVDEENGNYYFSQEFTNIRIEDVTSSGAPKAQKEFYDNNKEIYDFYTQTQSVKDGTATFSGLPTGLFLIVQEKAAPGFSQLGAFLVSVPYLEDGEYRYHVTAAIKSELEQEPEATEPPPTEPESPKLPQTGQLNWPIPLMITVGLGLFIVGWVLCFKQKREPHEK